MKEQAKHAAESSSICQKMISEQRRHEVLLLAMDLRNAVIAVGGRDCSTVTTWKVLEVCEELIRLIENDRYNQFDAVESVVLQRLMEEQKVERNYVVKLRKEICDKLNKKNDGWIKWEGGNCPVDSETNVKVKFRNGAKSYNGLHAFRYGWSHHGCQSDIIAYKIV